MHRCNVFTTQVYGCAIYKFYDVLYLPNNTPTTLGKVQKFSFFRIYIVHFLLDLLFIYKMNIAYSSI